MPRLGYIAIDENDYFFRLNRLMELAKESLEIKRNTIEKFTQMGLYPYSKFYLRQVNQRFNQFWKNHFSTIGLLGMNESIKNFMPGEDITTEKGRLFSLRVLDFMRSKLEEYQEETGNIYNLEATPGEGTTYRFARIDKQKFGKIVCANEEAYKQKNAKPYYTNSTQLPVDYTDDLFDALDLQDDLQCKYTGGTVFHTFVGERMDKDGVKNLIKKISERYHLPYFTITPTFSICPIHGYLYGEHEYCPKCDEEIRLSEQEVKNKDDLFLEDDKLIDEEILTNFKENKKEVLY
jgi:ribonucleoside-triphosphate reductase